METNNGKLWLELWSLLTEGEKITRSVWVKYNHMASTEIRVGANMIKEIKRRSEYGKYIIGFERGIDNHIHLLFDEEGQKLWKKNYDRVVEFCLKYND